MDIQVEKQQQSPVEYELTVTVPAETMTERVDTAIDDIARKANIPGFRHGHVPRKVVVQKYGQAVTSEAVSDILQEAYKEALQGSGLDAVSPGEMSDVQYEQGNPLTFKVSVEVLPQFELPPLSEISVELMQPTISDEDVMESLDGLRESHAVLTPITEPADRECVLTVDMQELDPSGLPIVGRVRKDLELDLTRINLGDEFVTRLTGVAAGQNVAIELPGKNAQGEETKTRYQVTVNQVRRKELPPMDDDFAKQVNPQLSSLDDLKRDVKRYLEARAAHEARERMYRQVADTLLHKVEFPVPPRMLDGYLDRMVEDATQKRKKKPGEDEVKRFKDEYRASAIWNLRWHMVRKKLIQDRNLDVGDDEVNDEINRLAQIEGQPAERFKARLSEHQMEHISEDILERKVLAALQSEVQAVPQPVTLAEFEGRAPGRVVTV